MDIGFLVLIALGVFLFILVMEALELAVGALLRLIDWAIQRHRRRKYVGIILDNAVARHFA